MSMHENEGSKQTSLKIMNSKGKFEMSCLQFRVQTQSHMYMISLSEKTYHFNKSEDVLDHLNPRTIKFNYQNHTSLRFHFKN